MQLPDWRSASVAPTMSRRPDPAALAAGQLQNMVQAVHASSTPSTTVAARRIWRKQSSQSAPADHVPGYAHLPPLPRLSTKFGERAFSHAGPATWNALPDNIRTVADPVKFRKLLKTHYFSQAFVDFCFSQCFSIWQTFVMHRWSRFS